MAWRDRNCLIIKDSDIKFDSSKAKTSMETLFYQLFVVRAFAATHQEIYFPNNVAPIKEHNCPYNI